MTLPDEKAEDSPVVNTRDTLVVALRVTPTVDVADPKERNISVACDCSVIRFLSVDRPAGKLDVVKALRLEAPRVK